ncbi:MAG: exonuclease SbcCD subunit D [Candidatus Bathyarchaeia archaeon]
MRFVHASDAHLGYSQYNLLERRQDFMKAFGEFIDKTIECSPDFVIFAGDLFNDPHPSNVVLGSAIELIDRIKAPFLVVPGSHDNVYSALVGTVLGPLHRGGHIRYLPIKPYAKGDVYVYGMTNFRRRLDFERSKDEYFERHPPTPKRKYNIFVLHQGVDFPDLKFHRSAVEMLPEELPKGFQYYASGHLHMPTYFKFNDGLFAYSGGLETFEFTQYNNEKGFYLVEVGADGQANVQHKKLTCRRRFNIVEEDFTGLRSPEIEEKAQALVSKADEEGVIVTLVLNGTLPRGVFRSDINYGSIKGSASKALYVHLVNRLKTPEETPGPIAIASAETLYSKAEKKLREYYAGSFRERSQDYAVLTVELVKTLSDETVRAAERKRAADKKIDDFYKEGQ